MPYKIVPKQLSCEESYVPTQRKSYDYMLIERDKGTIATHYLQVHEEKYT